LIFCHPLVSNILKIRIYSFSKSSLLFFDSFSESCSILFFELLLDNSNLRIDCCFEDDTCFFLEFLGEFFALEKSIYIFFDVILSNDFFGLFFSDFFFSNYFFFSSFFFSNYFFVRKIFFFLDSFSCFSSTSALIYYVLDLL